MSNKLYRLPKQGIFSGVCAGLAQQFNIPVLLVRAIFVVLSLSGLFIFTILIYIGFSYYLEPQTNISYGGSNNRTSDTSRINKIVELEYELQQSEQRLRDLERYVTSETFQVERRFRNL